MSEVVEIPVCRDHPEGEPAHIEEIVFCDEHLGGFGHGLMPRAADSPIWPEEIYDGLGRPVSHAIWLDWWKRREADYHERKKAEKASETYGSR